MCGSKAITHKKACPLLIQWSTWPHMWFSSSRLFTDLTLFNFTKDLQFRWQKHIGVSCVKRRINILKHFENWKASLFKSKNCSIWEVPEGRGSFWEADDIPPLQRHFPSLLCPAAVSVCPYPPPANCFKNVVMLIFHPLTDRKHKGVSVFQFLFLEAWSS